MPPQPGTRNPKPPLVTRLADAEWPERIVHVEYRSGVPFAATTQHTWCHAARPWFVPGRDRATGEAANSYDFDFCRRHRQLYWSWAASWGGPVEGIAVSRFCEPSPPAAELYVAEGIPIVSDGDRPLADAELLAFGYVRVPEPLVLDGGGRDPFAIAERCECIIWCTECEDNLPDDLDGMCEHLVWLDSEAWWVYRSTGRRQDALPGAEPVADPRVLKLLEA